MATAGKPIKPLSEPPPQGDDEAMEEWLRRREDFLDTEEMPRVEVHDGKYIIVDEA